MAPDIEKISSKWDEEYLRGKYFSDESIPFVDQIVDTLKREL